jgi:hypothetical protein
MRMKVLKNGWAAVMTWGKEHYFIRPEGGQSHAICNPQMYLGLGSELKREPTEGKECKTCKKLKEKRGL